MRCAGPKRRRGWGVVALVVCVAVCSGVQECPAPEQGDGAGTVGEEERAGESSGESEDLSAQVRRLELEIFVEANERRAGCGVERLLFDAELRAVARAHCEDMAARGYLGEVDPDGVGLADRLVAAGITCPVIGENIVQVEAGEGVVAGVVDAWMGDPGSRENLLDEGFARGGVGGAALGEEGFVFAEIFILGGSCSPAGPVADSAVRLRRTFGKTFGRTGVFVVAIVSWGGAG